MTSPAGAHAQDASDATDVIVVGSGAAGLATALAAHESGLSAVVLEKDGVLGGGTAYSYGLLWAGCNHLAGAAGIPDSAAEVTDYLRFVAGPALSQQRMQAFTDASPEVLAFLQDCGLGLRLVAGLTDHYYGSAPGAKAEGRTVEAELVEAATLGRWQDRIRVPLGNDYHLGAEELVSWGGMGQQGSWPADIMADRHHRDVRGLGVGLVSGLVRLLADRGVAIRVEAPAEQLLPDDGRIAGVRLRSGEVLRARRGVVLATGGYDSNPQLTETYEGLPGAVSMFPDSVAGDGLLMATERGAAVDVIRDNLLIQLGFLVPQPGTNRSRFREAAIIEMCSPHTMVVNGDGHRFANEAHFQYLAPRLRDFDPLIRRHRNLPCFLVFDSQYPRTHSFAGQPAGHPPPEWVHRADTLPELANRLGIRAEGLVDTAARMNRFAAEGTDRDFGRGSEQWRLAQASDAAPSRLGTISEAPFYGVQLRPSPVASAGLTVDEYGRVLHQRHHPIDGLYAIGNAAAHREYGIGYQHGLSLMSGMTFGYLAAQHMAKTATPGQIP